VTAFTVPTTTEPVVDTAVETAEIPAPATEPAADTTLQALKPNIAAAIDSSHATRGTVQRYASHDCSDGRPDDFCISVVVRAGKIALTKERQRWAKVRG